MTINVPTKAPMNQSKWAVTNMKEGKKYSIPFNKVLVTFVREGMETMSSIDFGSDHVGPLFFRIIMTTIGIY